MVFTPIFFITIIGIGIGAGYYYLSPYIEAIEVQEEQEPVITSNHDDFNKGREITQTTIIPSTNFKLEPEPKIIKTPLSIMEEKKLLLQNSTFKIQLLLKYENITRQYELKNAMKLSANYRECIHDSTPPFTNYTITGTKGNNDWYTSGIGIQFYSYDKCSQIYKILINSSKPIIGLPSQYWELGNGTALQFAPVFDLSYPYGTIKLNYHAIDTAKNFEEQKSVKLMMDTLLPTISILNASNPLRINEGEHTIRLYAQDFISGLDVISVTCPACETINFTIPMDDEFRKKSVAYIDFTRTYNKGIYPMTFTAYDYAGLYTSKELMIYVDFEIPRR